MNATEVLAELEALGSDQIKRIFLSHGAVEPFFGVKVGDMKTILKKIKHDHALALALYDSGNSDAMYLAGMFADSRKITKAELQVWVEKAPWQMISEYTVPWVASESPFGWELGMEWIESPIEHVATAGWCTLSCCLALQADEAIDGSVVLALLERIRMGIHGEKNRVRYCMNGFVISVGGHYLPLADKAMEVAREIGKVSVEQGGTACKVPFAPDYISAMVAKGNAGKKRKTVRC